MLLTRPCSYAPATQTSGLCGSTATAVMWLGGRPLFTGSQTTGTRPGALLDEGPALEAPSWEDGSRAQLDAVSSEDVAPLEAAVLAEDAALEVALECAAGLDEAGTAELPRSTPKAEEDAGPEDSLWDVGDPDVPSCCRDALEASPGVGRPDELTGVGTTAGEADREVSPPAQPAAITANSNAKNVPGAGFWPAKEQGKETGPLRLARLCMAGIQ